LATQRRKRSGLTACLAAVAVVAVGTVPLLPARATADSASEAEDLVRRTWYEGLPPESARALDDEAVARLVEMLSDPGEAAYHGNIALALGYSGRPGAYAALTTFAEAPVAGEVDRATFRSRTQVLLALGHLARRDGRALRWLLDAEEQGMGPPSWHFRHHRGPALRALLDERILTALALSASPAASRRIDRVIGAAQGPDAASRRRLRHARAARRLLDASSPERTPGVRPR